MAEGSHFSTYVFNPLAEGGAAPEADVISLLEEPKNDEAEKKHELDQGFWVPYDSCAFCVMLIRVLTRLLIIYNKITVLNRY